MEDKKDEKKEEDERLQFIHNYLILSRKLKADKWTKMLANEEYRGIIGRFFDMPLERRLILQLNTTGILVSSLSMSLSSRTKASYFLKKTSTKVTIENYRKVLIPGDMPPRSVEDLAILVEEAYIPILSNMRNHSGWPLVVHEDIRKHIHDLHSLICEVRGKMIGEILLPMPMGVEDIFSMELESNAGIHLKRNVEVIVHKWAHQIKEILKEEGIKADGGNSLPSAELEFWQDKVKNVESIYKQLRDPRVKKMALFLESMESPYLIIYNTLLKDVAAAVLKGRDIYMHLKPLALYFEEIRSMEFKNVKSKLKSLLHCVCLTWSNSKYYTSDSRIVALLYAISNLLVSEASKYVDQSSLFEGDMEDNKKRIIETLSILDHYQELYQSFREKIDTYFRLPMEPQLWNFHAKLVFDKVMKFQDRLKEILVSFIKNLRNYIKFEFKSLNMLDSIIKTGKKAGTY
ncbi:hypothetical protein KM043_013910 [Ampulex compressa]|nr:hypothetical protein KM043_013910 [Ampulex compressa]